MRPAFRGGYGTRDATAVADFAIEMGRAVAGARSSQIRRPEITTQPAKPRRAPRSVVFEAHVGVEHDEQRLRGAVVDEISGQLPEPQRREQLGLRMPRCGGTGSAPSSRRAGRVNGPVRPHAQAARPLTLRQTRVRPPNGGLFASVVMGGKLSSGRRWSARPRHGDDVVGDRHEGAEDQRDGQPGQDEREDDAAVAGGRPVRRWSPRPLLRPWCRCALAAAVAAHARGSMIAARRYGWMSFRLECPDRRLWTASLRLWIGRVSRRDQDHGPGTA